MATNTVRRAERISGETCEYWLAGRCNRNPCGFLHGGAPLPSRVCRYAATARQCAATAPHYSNHSKSIPEKNHLYNSRNVTHKKSGGGASTAKSTKKSSPSICKYWMDGNCVHSEKCRKLHSWFSGDAFSTLAELKEHKKVITGIALPFGSDKLFSSSSEGKFVYGTAIVVNVLTRSILVVK